MTTVPLPTESRGRRTLRVVLGLCALASAVLLAFSMLARADLITGDGVLINFQGGISPHALPRNHPSPVSLHVNGKVRPFRGGTPKGLARVIVEVNRHAVFTTRGLPSCRARLVRGVGTREALARCGDSLIGSGFITSHIDYPEQAPFPAKGRVLVYNSNQNGNHALIVHVFGRRPAAISTVLSGSLIPHGKPRGAFGPRLVVEMPEAREGWGYVNGFGLTFHRRYRYRGRRMSLISASCPAPSDINVAPFRSARGTFELNDGQVLTRALGGHCRAAE